MKANTLVPIVIPLQCRFKCETDESAWSQRVNVLCAHFSLNIENIKQI